MSSSEQHFDDEDEFCEHLRQKYKVGYSNPPVERQFQKGRSGNPGGRPRGITVGRAANLILKELYRIIPVREGTKAKRMTTLQAIIRSQVTAAAKGNVRVQRELVTLALGIEQKNAAQAAAKEAKAAQPEDTRECTDMELARWILWVLESAAAQADAAEEGEAAAKAEQLTTMKALPPPTGDNKGKSGR